MLPHVTVVIPAYNCEQTIERAIESVLNQGFQDFELIVVEDGSSDGTRDKLREVESDKIQVVFHEKNRGAAAARNTGMRLARGKYIALLDSDDEWLPNKLELQLKVLDAQIQENPLCKASYTAYFLIENGHSRVYVPENPTSKTLFLKCDLSPGSTLMFERDVLDIVGYLDESLPRYEDWDWLIRYAERFSFVPVNEPVVKVYHEHKTPPGNIEVAAKLFLDKHRERVERHGWLFNRKVNSMLFLEIAKYNFLHRKWGKGFYYLFRGVASYPFQSLDFYKRRAKGLSEVFSR